MPDAMPDNDRNSFLSHQVKPIDQMRRFRIELHGEVPYCLAPIGQKGELLRVLPAL